MLIKILIDMDGTMVDVMSSVAFAAYYTSYFDSAKATSRLFQHADFTEYNFGNFSSKDREKLFRAFETPGVFSKGYGYPNAVETVRGFLNQPERYKVQYVSHYLPAWTLAHSEKVEWLRKTFNTHVDRDFIVCKDRSNIIWDVLVDDCLENVFMCKEREEDHILVPDRPWNQGQLPDNAIRCYSWEEIGQHVREIGDDREFYRGLRMPEM